MLRSQTSNSSVGNDLGGRVRTLRRQRGLTLKALGHSAGLSHPFLSQLERGLARPSVASMERIAEALGVPVAHLWAPPRPRSVQLFRRNGGDAGLGELLAGGPAIHEWTGDRRWPEDPSEHAGDVLVYVARGAVDVELDAEVHELGEGEAVLFDGTTPHRLRRSGGPTTRALIVKA